MAETRLVAQLLAHRGHRRDGRGTFRITAVQTTFPLRLSGVVSHHSRRNGLIVPENPTLGSWAEPALATLLFGDRSRYIVDVSERGPRRAEEK